MAVLAALALLSCATVPQAEVFQLPGGVTMTITQGCPIDVDVKKLKREDSDAFAINDTSVPSPAIYHGKISSKLYFIAMAAGSYEPGTKFFCSADRLDSIILISGAATSSISIRPVKDWARSAGEVAIAAYSKNVAQCKKDGPIWSDYFTSSTITRLPHTNETASRDGFGGCENNVGEMSQALRLKVETSTFIISKIVNDLFIREMK